MADYLSKLKGLLGIQEPESTTPSTQFSPVEMRELSDPNSLVGRLLNTPKSEQMDYKDATQANNVHPSMASNKAYMNSGDDISFSRGYPDKDGSRATMAFGKELNRSINPDVANTEARKMISDSILQRAEKGGEFQPNDPNFVKSLRLINMLRKEQGVSQDIPVNYEDPRIGKMRNSYGEFSPEENKVSLYTDPSDLSSASTIAHELHHAKDYNSDPEMASNSLGHFLSSNRLGSESETESGRVDDIRTEALKRLAQMGKLSK